MKALNVELENCYGIKKLDAQFDFSKQRSYAIYAPNGSMKSSLAQTFRDISDGVESKDRIFLKRTSSRKISDENGVDLPREGILVVLPYDEVFGHTEKTSTLLVDAKLREEYEELYVDIDKAKGILLKALKEQSQSKKDLEKEISSTFTKVDDAFSKAILRVKEEVLAQKDAPFADIRYDIIFDDKVLSILATKNFKTAIQDYIKEYNALLAASMYFKKGTFNYYNASTIAKNLADNGFFDAKHTVNLNADTKVEITSRKELEDLIAKEKESILTDKELKKKFAEIEKVLQKNVTVRGFQDYLAEHDEILPKLRNMDAFKEELWKSYFKARIDLYQNLIDTYKTAEKRKNEIEKAATEQRTQWEAVIDIFNDRFFVPFKLTAKNRVSVILGQESMLDLGFVFKDGPDTAPLEKNKLMQVLSTGEKKALYILNIIFEVEARKKANQETLFVFDDIADSFDYKNKYAIIQYLKDIEDEPQFRQIFLTHNFDFFRTINSRFVSYKHCLMASKSSTGISLQQATGIRNVFVNDWQSHFFDDAKKRIASIPFIRNIVEYTKSGNDDKYVKLTSLLHWKTDSAAITQGDLDAIYKSVFDHPNGTHSLSTSAVVAAIHEEARNCLTASSSINMENKVVLSIAIRLAAEKFMVDKINNPAFLTGITSNQTPRLLAKFKEIPGVDTIAVDTIQRVILMTPENIHLNSFMYEPILDMSDEHLRRLYTDVIALK